MKYFLPISILSMMIAIAGCEEKYKFKTDNPGIYHQHITQRSEQVTNIINNFAGVLNMKDSQMLVSQFQRTKEQLKLVVEDVEGMAPFDKNEDYKNAALRLFRFYANSISNDFGEVVNVAIKPIKTPLDTTNVNSIIKRFDQAQKLENEEFKRAVNEFLAKHNINRSPIPSRNTPGDNEGQDESGGED